MSNAATERCCLQAAALTPGQLLSLDRSVQIVGRVETHGTNIQLLQHVEHLECGQAAGVRRQLEHPVALFIRRVQQAVASTPILVDPLAYSTAATSVGLRMSSAKIPGRRALLTVVRGHVLGRERQPDRLGPARRKDLTRNGTVRTVECLAAVVPQRRISLRQLRVGKELAVLWPAVPGGTGLALREGGVEAIAGVGMGAALLPATVSVSRPLVRDWRRPPSLDSPRSWRRCSRRRSRRQRPSRARTDRRCIPSPGSHVGRNRSPGRTAPPREACRTWRACRRSRALHQAPSLTAGPGAV